MYKVLIDNYDITKYLSGSLKSIVYTEHATGKADSIEVTFENNTGIWNLDWQPDKGQEMKVILDKVSCGTMFIDEIEVDGPPDEITIKGISIPLDAKELRTNTWQNTRLSQIAKDISSRYGFKVIMDCYDYGYKMCQQVDKTDFDYLNELCYKEGIGLKLDDKQIVMYDKSRYWSKNVIRTINKSDVYRYNLKSCSDKVNYIGCNIRDVIGNIKYSYKKADEGAMLNVVRDIESLAEAERYSKHYLAAVNGNETRGYVRLGYDIKLCAALNIELSDFYSFDGKYTIASAVHHYGKEPYTKLQVRGIKEVI